MKKIAWLEQPAVRPRNLDELTFEELCSEFMLVVFNRRVDFSRDSREDKGDPLPFRLRQE